MRPDLTLNFQISNIVGKNIKTIRTLPYQGSALPLSYLGHFERSHNNSKLTPLVHTGLGAFFINAPEAKKDLPKAHFSFSKSYGSGLGGTSFRGPPCGLGYLKAGLEVLVPYLSGHFFKKDQGLRVSAVPHSKIPRCLLTRKKAGGKFLSLNKKPYESDCTRMSGRGPLPQVRKNASRCRGVDGGFNGHEFEGTKALSLNGSLRE